MNYNQISFPDLMPLTFINQLIQQERSFPYLALIQYDDIIDYYLLKDLKHSTINQLSYYLYIAYDIRSFSKSNINIIRLGNDNADLQGKILDNMNANNALMVYDDIQGNSS